MTRTTTKKAINELEAEKLIEVVARRDEEGDCTSNVYYFLDHPVLHTKPLREPDRGGPESGLPRSETGLPQKLAHPGQNLAPKRFKEENHLKTTTTLGPPAREEASDATVGSSSPPALPPQPTPSIPKAILDLIPEAKRTSRHMSILAATLAVQSEEIVADGISRAITAAKSPDPWGMVMRMLVDMAAGCDWYAEEREQQAIQAERQESITRRRQKVTEADKQQRESENATNKQRRSDALAALQLLPQNIQMMLQAEARRVVGGDLGPVIEWALIDSVERYLSTQIAA